MRCFDAVVVGLGNVGLRYDLEDMGSERVASHANAYSLHPGFRLVAGIDPDETGRVLLEQRYAVPAFPSIASMLAAGIRPEVWSIAVPTFQHFTLFEEIIAHQPAGILCEKPLAQHLAEGERMVAAANFNGCVLAVNYMRRFEPGVQALRRLIAEGALGEIYKGTAWYSKGLLNSGSHIIDLLAFLLGDTGAVQVLAVGRQWDGHDPEPDVCLTFGMTRVMLLAAREECFSLIGFELIGTGGTVRYIDGGHRIELRRACNIPKFPGDRILEPVSEVLPSDLKRYQWHAVDALHRHLDKGDRLHSSGESALETLRTVDHVRTALARLS